MSLVLHVDGPRWRAHLQLVLTRYPDLVPVVKGNGYGFGLDVLLDECARLASQLPALDMVAVGTYHEAPRALARFPGDVLVLEPFRRQVHADVAAVADSRLVTTIADPDDLGALRTRHPGARVVLEALTSMGRHGLPPATVRATADDTVEGMTLHLPLGHGHEAEVDRWLHAVPALRRVFVSHVDDDELSRVRSRHPGHQVRPRVGTALWLGDPGSVRVSADVLDVHEVRDGDRIGYRQRRVRAGHVLVVSGGTAHGVALEAPSAAAGWRQRGIAVAEGLLDAAGRVRSPFTVGGRAAWFVEPPHMQVSLVHVPPGVPVPAMGDRLDVRVRHTTCHPDAVVIS